MVRDGQGGERILLDPNPPAPTPSSATITAYSPSPDGKLVAVNLDRGGNEITDVIGHFNDSLDDAASERADAAAFLEHVLH